MRIFIRTFVAILTASSLIACGGSEEKASTPVSFCKDTACVTEPIEVKGPGAGNPMVRITFNDCKIDTIHWEKGGMGVIKDMVFNEFITNDVRPTKEAFNCTIIGSKYAWIKFNDCTTGRGFLLRLPFDKDGTTSKYTSAINNFDPAFKVADGLVAFYDNTFIYVEDMETGLVAKQLLTDTGVRDIDFNDVHSLIETVDITKEKIYAKLKVDGKTIEHNNPLTFK